MATINTFRDFSLFSNAGRFIPTAQVVCLKFFAMLLNKILFGLFSLTSILAHPVAERREGQDDQMMVARAPKTPTKAKAAPVVQYTGGGVVADARKANNAPGREVPKLCKKLTDCSCPKDPNSKTLQSTSCINGVCSCNNKAVGFIANKFIDAVAAIGNAGITKAIGELMKGIATAKQVAGIIAGAVLGPQARAALKVALNVIPETGPSHIDKATKGILTKGL